MFKRVIGSKKFWVSLVGMVLSILAAAGVAIPPGAEAITMKTILAIVASFNIAQGIADAGSGGKTSAAGGSVSIEDLFKMAKEIPERKGDDDG